LRVGAGPAPDPFTVPFGYVCPSHVDKNNWLGGATYDDTFGVSQTGTEVLVQRTDGAASDWVLTLEFLCCSALNLTLTGPCTTCPNGTYANADISASGCVEECTAGSYSTVAGYCQQVRVEGGRSEHKDKR
jgi:hypothetical protein